MCVIIRARINDSKLDLNQIKNLKPSYLSNINEHLWGYIDYNNASQLLDNMHNISCTWFYREKKNVM